jgi:hypothetical protein
MYLLAFLLCLILGLSVTILIAARRVYERSRANGRLAGDERKCACGYILKGVGLPRCPECGRAIGFDKTFEELGVRPEELRDKTPRPQ